MRKLVLAAAFSAAAGNAAAADDKAPPANPVTIDQAQLDRMVEMAVARALASRPQGPPTNPSPYEPGPSPAPSAQTAYGTPQAAPQAVFVAQPVQMTSVNVLVPPGPLGAFLGKCGQKMAGLGRPHLRAYPLAPAASCAAPPVTLVPATQAVPVTTQVPLATPQGGGVPFTFVR